LTTSRTLLNINVIGQRSRSRGLLCVSCVHHTAWTSWPGFSKCHSLDGATITACGSDWSHPLAVLSLEQSSWQSCFS